MTDLQKIEFDKSIQKIKDNRQLEYFKKELIKVLESKEEQVSKAIEDYDKAVAKSFKEEFGIEKAGYGVGTIRVWKGQKFRKIAPGKWRKVYDSNTRGANQSIAILSKKIKDAQSVDELLQLVMENTNRFMDSEGKLLPIVEKLNEAVKATKTRLNSFDKYLDKGLKQWNDGETDFDYPENVKEDIAFNLKIEKDEIPEYVQNARKTVNDYINSKDTEFVHYDWSNVLCSDKFWEDPKIKSQFETGHSSMYYDPDVRKDREDGLLNGSSKMENKFRPIYGMAVRNNKIWEENNEKPGNIAIVLNKDVVKKRTSLTIGDSLNHLKFNTFQKDFGTAISKGNDVVRQLVNYNDLFKDGEIVDKYEYLETQTWGGIDFRKGDVKSIVINKRYVREDSMERLNKLMERCKQYNIDVVMMEEWK